MKDFYYQIKGKDGGVFGGNWSWPPIFSGKVSANDKKHARLLIEKDYGRAFPLRVLKKDIDNNDYLLSIREINESDSRTISLFEFKSCKQCESKFRIIDKYNDSNERNKGSEFCCHECSSKFFEESRFKVNPGSESPKGSACIYKITNKKTGMCYIGKTTQVFTLRWYQHFYQSGDCKFHEAIKNSEFTDWSFEVLEVVNHSCDVAMREQYWIDSNNSISNGYNSATAYSGGSNE